MRAPVGVLDFLDEELAALERAGRRRVVRTVEARSGCEVVVRGQRLVNFASNDYLGLGTDGRLAQAAAAAEVRVGVGAGASRLISGHTAVTDELERALAALVGAPSARVFNSGYAANTGLVPTLVGAGDVVFSDELDHASLIDGCRLAKARVVVYPHGDAGALEAALGRERGRRRVIVTESVFSMDGDVAPLAAIVALGKAHGAIVVVDDAHAFGVLGPRGAGLGWASGADIVVGTLGKSVGAAGAFVAGPPALAELLWNRARPLVFSTGLSIGTQAAALEGVRIVASDEGAALRRAVRENVVRLSAALGREAPPAAILPIVVGDDTRAVAISKALEADGLWVPAIRPPTVPEGTARLRVTLAANHAPAMIDALAGSLRDRLGVLAPLPGAGVTVQALQGREPFHVERDAEPGTPLQADVATPEGGMFHVEHQAEDGAPGAPDSAAPAGGPFHVEQQAERGTPLAADPGMAGGDTFHVEHR